MYLATLIVAIGVALVSLTPVFAQDNNNGEPPPGPLGGSRMWGTHPPGMGMMPRGSKPGNERGPHMMGGMAGTSTDITNTIIKGNGQPVVAGTVSQLSGSTLTITTGSRVTYTIDVSNATIAKDNATSTISGISVGDYVIVQGSVSGTSVMASSVIDTRVPASGPGGENAQGPLHGGGFFGSISQFFKHLFGF